eukprot:5220133-Ditylum_brightwellii.AAC.1
MPGLPCPIGAIPHECILPESLSDELDTRLQKIDRLEKDEAVAQKCYGHFVVNKEPVVFLFKRTEGRGDC